MSDLAPTGNPRRFADLTERDDRNYWQEVILRAGPHAYETQYVCSIRIGGSHWSLAHAAFGAHQCIEAILGNDHVARFHFERTLNRTVAELLVALLLEGKQTTLQTARWYEDHAVLFRDGTKAHIQAIGQHAFGVRISRNTRGVSPPTFYVLARSTGELVDVYIVADSAVATWKGEGFKSRRPPPAPGIAKACEIEIPHVRAFVHRRGANTIETHNPPDGRSDE
jgi:hypothetical protein